MTKLLLLAANPRDSQAQLQLDQEIHEIDQEISHAQFNAQFKFELKVAVRLRHLSEYLEAVNPDLVHFSGHGSRSRHGNRSSEIILLDKGGNSLPVSQEAIKMIFSRLKGNIRCVVINACNGESLANALAEDIDCTIGMLDEIDDFAAIEFAREFYRHLANGKNIKTAYDLGCAQIPDGQNLVRLHARKADPSKIIFVPEAEKSEVPRKEQSRYIALGIIAIVGVVALVISLIIFKLYPLVTPSLTIPAPTLALSTETPPNLPSTPTMIPVPSPATMDTVQPILIDATRPPQNPNPGEMWLEPISGMKFVFVPAGEFKMGSTNTQIDALCKKYEPDCDPFFKSESPQLPVTTIAYWIGMTEVTNAQFHSFADGDGYSNAAYWGGEESAGWKWRSDKNVTQPNCWSDSGLNGDNQPVVCISWYEAMAYANWLKDKTGLEVRLPSEAEWEKAARGMDGRIYPWDNDFDGNPLNYCDKNCPHASADMSMNDGYTMTAPVGSFPNGKSPYNALDMVGNVWEWNNTLYQAYPYKANDGREISDAKGSRIVRGGSWTHLTDFARSASRFWFDPDEHQRKEVGFRVVFSHLLTSTKPITSTVSASLTIETVAYYYNEGTNCHNSISANGRVDLKKLDCAIENYLKVIQIDPNHDGAFNRLGYAYFVYGLENLREKYQKEAISDLTYAIDNWEKHAIHILRCKQMEENNSWESRRACAATFGARGLAHYIRNDITDRDLAFERYKESIEIDENYHVAYFQRGAINYHLGKYDDALKDFENVIRIYEAGLDTVEIEKGPYTDAYCFHAQSLRHLGRDVAAEKDMAIYKQLDQQIKTASTCNDLVINHWLVDSWHFPIH